MRELYTHRLLAWWKEQRLVTVREISTTKGLHAPAGTTVHVIAKRNALEVRTPRCPHCGVSLRVAGVPPGDFAFAGGVPVEP